MGFNALKFFILLTFVVGFVVPTFAQIEPADTIPPADTAAAALPTSPADTAGPDDKTRLSTDSVYLSETSGSEGLLPSMVEYTATDSIVGSISQGKAELYNEAYVKYEELTLTAGYIMIDFNKSEIYAEGIKDTAGKIVQKPVFTESGKSYRADNMRYNFETKKAKIEKVITQEGEGYLHGEDVKKVNDKVFYIHDASYTTCSHEHPHFEINTPKAKVITGDKLVTQFAYISVLDVPTPLMVPFGFFPTTDKRKSGIILPSYGSSEYRGYFLRGGGFYWAINDYLDLTLSGDIYTQGGYGLKASTNYKVRYKYSGNFAANYNRIRFGREEFAEFDPNAFDNRSDYGFTWNHNQDPKANPSLRFNSKVNIASQNFYAVTSTDAEAVLNNRLNSSVSLQKNWVGRPYNMNIAATHSQNNNTKDLQLTLPEVNFNLNRQFPFKRKATVGNERWYEKIYVGYTGTGENRINTRLGKPLFSESVFRDSARNGIRHTIPIGASYKVMKYFNFVPSLNYSERWYFQQAEWGLNEAGTGAVVVDTNNGFYAVREFNSSANLTTKLYGMWRYRGFLRALRHVATPTVGLGYRPDFGTDYWGYYQEVELANGEMRRQNRYPNGIYGNASTGKSGTVNFRLDNTLEAKVRDKSDSTGLKKIKILERLSLSTNYNMAAEEKRWSPLSLTMSSSAFDGILRLNYSANYSFYGYDQEAGKEVAEYAYQVNDMLLRPVRQNFTAGLALSPDRFKKKGKRSQNEAGTTLDEDEGSIDELPEPAGIGVTEGDIDYYRRMGYVDFDVPWTLNLNYNARVNYSGLESSVAQSLDISGDLELTENWRVGFRTGYDLTAKDLTYTSMDFYRDLHCWDLRLSWVPFGFQQSYSLTIRVKAPSLSDLKLERRRGYGDFQR